MHAVFSAGITLGEDERIYTRAIPPSRLSLRDIFFVLIALLSLSLTLSTSGEIVIAAGPFSVTHIDLKVVDDVSICQLV